MSGVTCPYTSHCATVACVLTSQFFHGGDTGTTGKVSEMLDAPHLVAHLCRAVILPLKRTQNQTSKYSKLTCSHLSPFDTISRHREGEKSIHGWFLLIRWMARWGSPVPCVDFIWFHLGRRSRMVPQDQSDIFWLLPYQKLRQLSSVPLV